MTLTGDDAKRIWGEVKENRKKLDSCRLHQFQGLPDLGKIMTCVNCGGRLQPGHVAMYVAGFKAAGGREDMILPAYQTHKKTESQQ